MTPRQLKYFLRIAQLKSFTKAAAVLHVAQPALSRQIQQLESDLGVQLFVRSDAGVVLTDAGVALTSRAAKLLEHFATVRDEVEALSKTVHGRLHFGMPPSLFHLVTVPMLLEFRCLHPSVLLNLAEGISSTVYELLLAGRLDIGIVLSTESMQGLNSKDLFQERLFLAGAPGTLGAAHRVTLEDVAAKPLVLTQRPNAMRIVLEDALATRGLKYTSILDANSSRIQSEMAAAGVGFSVLPYSALAQDAENGRVEAVPIEDLQITWTLIYSRERALSAAAQRLLEILLEISSRHVDSGRWPGLVHLC